MKKLYFLLFTLLIAATSFGQTTVFQESFETGNSGTPSVTCNDGFNDFFTRTDGSDIGGGSYTVTGGDGTFYFAAQDIDATECGASATETLTFTGIAINTYTNLTLALLAAEDDASDTNEDWDAADNVLVEVQIDGGGYTTVIAFESMGTTNTAPALDTNSDGDGDGTQLSPSFQEFTAALGTGTTLDIRITFTLNSGDEDIAIDNVRVIDNYSASPTILVGSGVSGLDYELGNGPSNEGSFTVEGSDLTDDVVLTAPTNFEISETSGSGFGSSVTLTQTGGSVATTTIYVRLKSLLAVNSYAEDVTATSTGASSKTVSVSGTVYNPLTNALVTTGVYDAGNTNHAPKGIELYVLQNIADLSIFGIGSANNGGGTDGVEFTFPAVGASMGDRIFIASEAPFFTSFFGFAPDYTDGAMGINGDDAIELFENGQVIDVFGDINTDGSGEAWEYLDGWAYRNNSTGPDGSTFNISNWTFSGVGNLDGTSGNGSSTTPYPASQYSLSTKDNQIEGFSMYPNPTNLGYVNISSRSNSKMEVAVYDILGKQVVNETVANKTLDVSSLNTGIYIMKVSQDDASVTKKLVIH